MKMKRIFLGTMAFSAIALMITSCGNKKQQQDAGVVEETVEEVVAVAEPTQTMSAKDLNGKWKISSVNGEAIAPKEEAFLEINVDSMKIHGKLGCNIYNTTFELGTDSANHIKINDGMLTMMTCPDQAIEDKIVKVLPTVIGFEEVACDSAACVGLIDQTGNPVIVLSK